MKTALNFKDTRFEWNAQALCDQSKDLETEIWLIMKVLEKQSWIKIDLMEYSSREELLNWMKRSWIDTYKSMADHINRKFYESVFDPETKTYRSKTSEEIAKDKEAENRRWTVHDDLDE